MPFSWEDDKLKTIVMKIRREKNFAGNGKPDGFINPDFSLNHVDEVRAAARGDFTALIKRIRDKTRIGQNLAMKRRLKLLGK